MRLPALLLLLAVPVAAAPQPPATFAADPRLQAPLLLALKDRPLSEVTRSVGAKYRVKLTAAPETADDKVTLFVEGRPVGAVLDALAKHLGFVWVRAGDGWELTQSIAAKRREAELRQADLAPIRAEADQVAALTQRPQKELLDRVKEIDRKLQSGEIAEGDRAAALREKQLLLNTALSQPGVPRLSIELFHALGDAQTARLLDGEQLRLSTADHSLSDPLAGKIQAATDLGGDAGAQRQAEVVAWLAEGSPDHEFGPAPRKDRALALHISYNSVRGTGANYRIIGARWSAGSLQAEPAPAPIPDDPFYQRSVDLTLPGPEKALPAFFSPGPREGRRALANVWLAWPTLGDLAEALRRAGGPQVVADSFVSARFDPNQLRGRHTLADVLRFLDRELDYTWRRDGDTLFLRSRHFYRDRPAEVPDRILRTWAARVAAPHAVSLDALAELALALSNPRARSVQDYWGWYLRDAEITPPDWFYSSRHHLRFWGGLSAAQKGQARAGVLPVSALTPAQRQAWSAGLFSPPETLYTPVDLKRLPTEADLAAGGFSLQSRDAQEQLFTSLSPDGKTRTATSIVAGAGPEMAQFLRQRDGGPAPDGPPSQLVEYQFRYHLAGEAEPARSVRFSVPKLKPSGS